MYIHKHTQVMIPLAESPWEGPQKLVLAVDASAEGRLELNLTLVLSSSSSSSSSASSSSSPSSSTPSIH
jgi:hypothetical protein